MSIALFGYSGFVGSNILQFYKVDQFYNSKNINEARNKTFETIYFCAIPAMKWHANKYPNEDADAIDSIKDVLKTVKANKFILISTIDVYENVTNESDESSQIFFEQNHTYGKNRYLFEQFIMENYADYNIVRLPALLGKGLKKNIIYDLINNNNVNLINLKSAFQWYDLEWLKNDIDVILKNNIKICNLFTEPVETSDIVKVFSKIYGIDYEFQIDYVGNNSAAMNYNLKTKFCNYFTKFNPTNNYIRTRENVLESLEKFFIFNKIDKNMLCVSNICTKNVSDFQFACILKLYGISQVQIAPTKLAGGWENLQNFDNIIAKTFINNGLKVRAFQSITYGLQYNIFDDTRDMLLDHLKTVVDVAARNDVHVLVFGCPNNRKILNDDLLKNEELFVEFFRKLGEYCENKNVKICIENVSSFYKCNYLNSICDCASIVKKINNPNIKTMIDIGNALMEKDEWYDLRDRESDLYNIDVSNKFLKPLSVNENDNTHKIFNFMLKLIDYKNTINLEMILENDENELKNLCESLQKFIHCYGK